MLMLRYLAAIERPYSGASVMRRFFPSMLMVALFATLTACGGGGGGGGSFGGGGGGGGGGERRSLEPTFAADEQPLGVGAPVPNFRSERPSSGGAEHDTQEDPDTGRVTTTLRFTQGERARYDDGVTYHCSSPAGCVITSAEFSAGGEVTEGAVTEGVIHAFRQPRYVRDFYAQPNPTREGIGITTLGITLDQAVPLSNYGGGDLEFDYTITGIESSDVDSLSGTITVRAGEGNGEVSIRIEDDDKTEGTETMRVTLDTPLPTNAIDTGITVTVDLEEGTGSYPRDIDITDNENPPTTVSSFAADADNDSIAEASGSTTLTLRLNREIPAGDDNLTFPYTISGIQAGDITDNNADSDNNSLTGNITVDAGSATGTLQITAVQDTADEGAGETMTVTLGALPRNARNVRIASSVAAPRITITDDDGSTGIPPASVSSFAEDNDPIAEAGGSTTLTLRLNRVIPAGDGDLTFPYTISGIQVADIIGNLSGDITVDAGSATGTLRITAAPDTVDEGAGETMIVRLGTLPRNARNVQITSSVAAPRITITDDDGSTGTPPTSVSSFAENNDPIAEAGGSTTLTLQLNRVIPAGDGNLTFPYTISGTNITAADITAASLTGSIVVRAGSDNGTAIITGLDDTVTEGNETMTVTLGTLPPNASGTQITSSVIAPQITITDDEDGSMLCPATHMIYRHSSAGGNADINILTSEVQPLTIGAPVVGSFSSSSDVDVYSITVTQPGRLRIHTSGPFDTEAHFTDSNCRQLSTVGTSGTGAGSDDGVDDNFSFDTQSVAAGTYHLFVWEWIGRTTGNYDLTVTLTPVSANSVFSAQTAIATGAGSLPGSGTSRTIREGTDAAIEEIFSGTRSAFLTHTFSNFPPGTTRIQCEYIFGGTATFGVDYFFGRSDGPSSGLFSIDVPFDSLNESEFIDCTPESGESSVTVFLYILDDDIDEADETITVSVGRVQAVRDDFNDQFNQQIISTATVLSSPGTVTVTVTNDDDSGGTFASQIAYSSTFPGAGSGMARSIDEDNTAAAAAAGIPVIEHTFSNIPNGWDSLTCVFEIRGSLYLYGTNYLIKDKNGSDIDVGDLEEVFDEFSLIDENCGPDSGNSGTLTYNVQVVNDEYYNFFTGFTIELTSVAAFDSADQLLGDAMIGSPNTLSLVINDDDPSPPGLRTTIDAINPTEADTSAGGVTLRLSRALLANEMVEVNYTVARPGGSRVSAADINEFSDLSGTNTVTKSTPGATTIRIPITATDDTLDDDGETVSVNIHDVYFSYIDNSNFDTSIRLSQNFSAQFPVVLTIADNDDPLPLPAQFSREPANGFIEEGGEPGTITVTVNDIPNNDVVTFNYILWVGGSRATISTSADLASATFSGDVSGNPVIAARNDFNPNPFRPTAVTTAPITDGTAELILTVVAAEDLDVKNEFIGLYIDTIAVSSGGSVDGFDITGAYSDDLYGYFGFQINDNDPVAEISRNTPAIDEGGSAGIITLTVNGVPNGERVTVDYILWVGGSSATDSVTADLASASLGGDASGPITNIVGRNDAPRRPFLSRPLTTAPITDGTADITFSISAAQDADAADEWIGLYIERVRYTTAYIDGANIGGTRTDDNTVSSQYGYIGFTVNDDDASAFTSQISFMRNFPGGRASSRSINEGNRDAASSAGIDAFRHGFFGIPAGADSFRCVFTVGGTATLGIDYLFKDDDGFDVGADDARFSGVANFSGTNGTFTDDDCNPDAETFDIYGIRTVYDDAVESGGETIIFRLDSVQAFNSSSVSLGSAAITDPATLTLTLTDSPPTLVVTDVTVDDIDEGEELDVSLTADQNFANGGYVIVGFDIYEIFDETNFSSLSEEDFDSALLGASASGSASNQATVTGDGTSSLTFTVGVNDDANDENDESGRVLIRYINIIDTGAFHDIITSDAIEFGDPNVNAQDSFIIRDNDDPAPPTSVASFAENNDPIAEAGGISTVTLTLDRAVPAGDAPLSFPYAITGIEVEDITATSLSGNIEVAAGSDNGTLQITAMQDAVTEGDQTMTVTLGTPPSNASGDQITSSVSAPEITITDDETPPTSVSTFVAAPTTIAEAGGISTVTLTLNQAIPAGDAPLTFPYTITGIEVEDITATSLSGNITVAAGSDNGALVITAADDAEDEGSGETMTVTLGPLPSNAGNVQITSNVAAPQITITDDDGSTGIPPTSVSTFVAAPTTIAEAGGISTVTLTLDRAVPAGDAPLSFPYTITGIQAADITASLSGNIEVAAGSDNGTLQITAMQDAVTEGDQTMTVTLGTLPGNASGDLITSSVSAPQITITDDETPPTSVSTFVAAPTTIAEAGGISTVRLTLNQAIPAGDAPLTFLYTITGIEVEDITAASLRGNITVAAGSDNGALVITAADDAEDEGSGETMTITLGALPSNAGNVQITSNVAAPQITITDDDGSTGIPPTSVSTFVAAPTTIAEAGGISTVTLTLDRAVPAGDAPLSFPYTISGIEVADITATSLSGNIEVAAGSDNGTLQITAMQDAVTEGDQTMTVTLGTPPSNASGDLITSSVSAPGITITDDETPPTSVASFAENNDPIAEAGGISTVTLRLNRAIPAGDAPLSFPYAISGIQAADITATSLSGNIEVAAGSDNGTLQITAMQDAVIESDQTMTITLGALPSNAGNVQITSSVAAPQITIVDDDGSTGIPPTSVSSFLAAPTTIAEAGGISTVTLRLNRAIPAGDAPLSFPYTITGIQAADITASLRGNIEVAAGSDNGTLQITAMQDAVTEGDQTMTVTLGTLPDNANEDQITSSVNAPEITITDDETPPTSVSTFVAAPTTIAEAGGVSTVTLTLNQAIPAGDAPLTFPYAISGIEVADITATSLSGNITVAAGSDNGAFRITAMQDTVIESDQSMTVTLGTLPSNASGDQITSSVSAPRITIIDDDRPPSRVVSFVASTVPTTDPVAISEQGGRAVLTLTLDNPARRGLTFPYTITGIEVEDIRATSLTGTITVAAGRDTGAIGITASQDTVTEGDQTMIVTLGTPPLNASGEQITSSVSAPQITITDDETPPTSVASFAENNDPIAEARGSTTLTLRLNRAVPSGDAPLSFPYTITGIEVEDITAASLSGNIEVAAGSATGTLRIVATQNTVTEGDQTMTVTLGPLPSNAGNVQITSSVAAPQITITDDDVSTGIPPTSVNGFFASPTAIAEDRGSSTLTLQLNRPIPSGDSNLTFPYIISGAGITTRDLSSHHRMLSGSIMVMAGRATATIQITASQDTVSEGDEVMTVTLGTLPFNANGNQITSRVSAPEITITDDETPPTSVVSFLPLGNIYNIAEAGGSTTLRLRLNQAIPRGDAPLSFPYTISNDSVFEGEITAEDIATSLTGNITVAAGSSSGTLRITAMQDAVTEARFETMAVTLGPLPSNARGDQITNSASRPRIRIDDDETPPTRVVSFVASETTIAEAGGSSTLTLRLDNPIPSGDRDLAFLYTIVGEGFGSGFRLRDIVGGNSRESVVVRAGSAVGTATITARQDTLVEGDETMTVTLLSPPANPRGDPISNRDIDELLITIRDDDVSEVSVVVTVTLTDCELRGIPFPTVTMGGRVTIDPPGARGTIVIEGTFREYGNGRITNIGTWRSAASGSFPWQIRATTTTPIGGPGDCIRRVMFTRSGSLLASVDQTPDFAVSSIPDQTWIQNTGIEPLVLPKATGGDGVLTYSLSPSLPNGLTFDSSNREITGIPATPMLQTPFTLTATDADGSMATLFFNITVLSDLIPEFSPDTVIPDQDWTQNSVIEPLTLPEATGGDGTLTYALSPALPDGVTFNPETREVSGTPVVAMAQTLYLFTATDEDGDAAALPFHVTVKIDPVILERQRRLAAQTRRHALESAQSQAVMMTTMTRDRLGAVNRDRGLSISRLPDETSNMSDVTDDIIDALSLQYGEDLPSGQTRLFWMRNLRDGLLSGDDSEGVGFGLEWASESGRDVHGLAVSVSTESLAFNAHQAGLRSAGSYAWPAHWHEDMTIIAPYLTRTRDAIGLWAVAGLGVGDVRLAGGSDAAAADSTLAFLNAGSEWRREFSFGPHLDVEVQGMTVHKAISAYQLGIYNVPEVTARLTRLSGDATLSWPFGFAGGTLIPRLEADGTRDFADILPDEPRSDFDVLMGSAWRWSGGIFSLSLEGARSINNDADVSRTLGSELRISPKHGPDTSIRLQRRTDSSGDGDSTEDNSARLEMRWRF